MLFRGGEGWIRTTEVTDNRFTVCSLWPLGNLSIGAGDRNRTNNLLITNQLLCLLSYTSVFSCWCLGADSNHRHRDFQSLALPPELPRHIVREEPCISYRHYRQDEVIFDCCGHKVRFLKYMAATVVTATYSMATRRGLEPLTSSVTGWRTNQLYYRAKIFLVGLHGLEPRTDRL